MEMIPIGIVPLTTFFDWYNDRYFMIQLPDLSQPFQYFLCNVMSVIEKQKNVKSIEQTYFESETERER